MKNVEKGVGPEVGTPQASRSNYAEYERMVAERHLIPHFVRHRVPLDQAVLDVGCGLGGIAIALAAAGVPSVVGVDLNEDYITAAREKAAETAVQVQFYAADATQHGFTEGPFGLIIMHDVIEHLIQPEFVLERLLPQLDAGGYLYVSFPPWRGPYAGHQHNAAKPVRYMPYLHAFSPSLFLKLINWSEKRRWFIMELQDIVANRLTMDRFEQMAWRSGWEVVHRSTYFLRPEFMRMGLPVIPNGWLSRLPFIGECLTTGCEYLLVPR